jgi:hypothetical protein
MRESHQKSEITVYRCKESVLRERYIYSMTEELKDLTKLTKLTNEQKRYAPVCDTARVHIHYSHPRFLSEKDQWLETLKKIESALSLSNLEEKLNSPQKLSAYDSQRGIFIEISLRDIIIDFAGLYFCHRGCRLTSLSEDIQKVASLNDSTYHFTRFDIAQDFIGLDIFELIPLSNYNEIFEYSYRGLESIKKPLKERPYFCPNSHRKILQSITFTKSSFELKYYRKDIEQIAEKNELKKFYYSQKIGKNICTRIELKLTSQNSLKFALVAFSKFSNGKLSAKKFFELTLSNWAKSKSIRKRTKAIKATRWPIIKQWQQIFFQSSAKNLKDFAPNFPKDFIITPPKKSVARALTTIARNARDNQMSNSEVIELFELSQAAIAPEKSQAEKHNDTTEYLRKIQGVHNEKKAA